MISREEYTPGPANLAHIEKNDEDWTLVLVKDLRHPPEKVWLALTDPVHLREWAPFDADKNLGAAGARVTLTTVGAPNVPATETTVTRAEAPRVLEYQWGGGDMRWELTATDKGTLLTLWAKINRRFIAMGAAGWHLCFDILELLLDGQPIGRIVAGDALQFEGWQRLHREYAKQFHVKTQLGKPKEAFES